MVSPATPLLGWDAVNEGEGRSRNQKYGTNISAEIGWECLLAYAASPVMFVPRWRSSGNGFMPFVFILGISGGTYATTLELCLQRCVLANVFCVPSLFNLVLWALLSEIYLSQYKTAA